MRRLKAGFAATAALILIISCDDSGPAGAGGRTDPPDTAGTERVLLEIPQWGSNHNGGGLTFDNDGYLYLGLGDGGGAGDNEDNGQDPTNLLGTILRIAVGEDAPYYEIPADNPFVAGVDGWRGEIFAYGFRNPWRISVDPATNQLWAGDVGQDAWEEVDVVTSGGNFGWDCREGAHAYTGTGTPSSACATFKGFVDPVWEYAHQPGRGSITGGAVYRGAALPALAGCYVYADYLSGDIWALSWDGQTASNEHLVDAPFAISSFGVDEDGELFFLQYSAAGKIHRLVDSGGYVIEEAFPDLTFDRPVDLRSAGDGSGRLFVVEQAGVIKAFDSASPDSAWTYQDLTDRVTCCGERGLLGLAFHPDFAGNGYIYVYYTANVTQSVGRLSRIKAE